MQEIIVNDSFQQNYSYTISAPSGKEFDPRFQPQLTPEEMLSLGVFGGVYFHDRPDEFPAKRYTHMRSSPEKKAELNFFGVNASLPLEVRQAKGWIYHEDPRGWFQRYCRYYMGRRIPDEDDRQIKRRRAMKRHVGAIKKNCLPLIWECRTKQRQALLHWAYDARNL